MKFKLQVKCSWKPKGTDCMKEVAGKVEWWSMMVVGFSTAKVNKRKKGIKRNTNKIK